MTKRLTKKQQQWLDKHNLTLPVLCKTCQKPTKWYPSKGAFSIYCSVACMHKDVDIKHKRKQTNIERYGVDSPAKSSLIKQKQKQTMLKKYGVEHNTHIDGWRERVKQTNMQKYGVEHPMLNDIIKQKQKQTMLKKYGVEHNTHIDGWRERVKQTNMQKYGQQTRIFNAEIEKQKRKQTMLKNYGVEFFKQKHINKQALNILNNKQQFENLLNNNNFYKIAEELGITPGCITRYKLKHNIFLNKFQSSVELEILSFLKNILKEEIITNARSIIPPYEIDIVVPSYKLAFEINGIYWHSEQAGKNKNYHIQKAQLCKEQGYRLIQIYETEWLFKKNIVKSRILSILNKTTKIPARKCTINIIDDQQLQNFLNENYLYNYTLSSNYNVGLFYKNEIVGVMAFYKKSASKKHKNYLLKYLCFKQNVSIIGGVSKMFKFFLKQESPTTIISFLNNRWDSNKIFKNLNFNFLKTQQPNYYYFLNKNPLFTLQPRIKFQKHKLKNILEKYDPNLSEWENMQNNGYNRIWDCGNDVWIWKRE